MRRLAPGPPEAHHPLRRLPLGEIVRRDHREDGGHLELLRLGGEGVPDVREHLADHHVDPIALHELAELGDGGARVARGVLDDQLDLAARDLLPGLLQVHLEAIHGVAPDLGGPAGERRQEADLDRLLRLRGGGRRERDPAGQEQQTQEPDRRVSWAHGYLPAEMLGSPAASRANWRFMPLTCARYRAASWSPHCWPGMKRKPRRA